MTGRSAGFCAGWDRPGYANRYAGAGRGFGARGGGFGGGAGRGFGGRGSGGRGWRHRFYATGLTGWQRAGWMPGDAPAWSPEEESAWLRREAEQLEAALTDVRERLQRLEDK